jgi:hypothetical protein
MMAPVSASAFRVPGSVWAGLCVLGVGLGVSAALLTGFGGALRCGTFGLDCVVGSVGLVLCTLCAALALLLRGLAALRRARAAGGRRSGWPGVVQGLTVVVAGAVSLSIVLMLGFAGLVLMR